MDSGRNSLNIGGISEKGFDAASLTVGRKIWMGEWASSNSLVFSPGQGPEEPAVGMVKTAPKEASHPRGRWTRSFPSHLRGPYTLHSPCPSLHLVVPSVIFPGFPVVISEGLMAHPNSHESPHCPALPQLLLPSPWRHLSLLTPSGSFLWLLSTNYLFLLL